MSKATRLAKLVALALGAGVLLAAPARGARVLAAAQAVEPAAVKSQIPEGQIEGACGLATFDGEIYVSDFYHRSVDVFPPATRILVQPAPNPLEVQSEGPCGLAFDGAGHLYVDYWHRRVVRSSLPYAYGAAQLIDSGESTGVAVDPQSEEVYVADRSHVAVYDPSQAGFEADKPLAVIGEGSLVDAYGVAAFGARVYVADAGDDTVKVFEPAKSPSDPTNVIRAGEAPGGGFNSLVDSAIAIDPTNEHVLVLDNLQPGFAQPEATVREFSPTGAYLGELCSPILDGGPSGIAFEGSALYVTSGNSEEAEVSKFGPYIGSCPGESGPQGAVGQNALPLSVQAPRSVALAPAAPPVGATAKKHRRHPHKHRHHHARHERGRAR